MLEHWWENLMLLNTVFQTAKDECELQSGSSLLLHDFNDALRRSITHIATFFISTSALVIDCVIHGWQTCLSQSIS